MKSFFVCLSLSLFSAGVFAADGKPCVVPVIPAISTQLVDYMGVVHRVKAWNACVAGQQTEENMRLHQEVTAQAMAWLAATADYAKEHTPAENAADSKVAADRRSNAEFDMVFDKIDALVKSPERARLEAAQRFNMERQIIFPGQVLEMPRD